MMGDGFTMLGLDLYYFVLWNDVRFGAVEQKTFQPGNSLAFRLLSYSH